MDTSSTTQVAEILVKHWRSGSSSRTKLKRTPTCWSLVEGTVRRGSIGAWMGKSIELGMSFFHWKQGLYLPVYVDETGKNQHMASMWKKLRKHVDLDEPTSFLVHVNEIILEEYTKMFESHISAGATEKLLLWEKPHEKTVACSYDMEGHARKCVQRYCELANKKVEQWNNVSSLSLDDHQVKQEELESVGELSQVRSQIVLKYLFVHGTTWKTRHILWTVNRLASPITK